MKKWRCTEEEHDPNKPLCFDCGLHYVEFPVEMLLSAEQWELINPSPYKGCGLLCHNCMIERLRTIGIARPEITAFIVNNAKAQ